ncbi:Coenzyme F420 hydrogenase/dehydrogenase, beta subunit C-terminal domain [Arthrobacter sp. lap29]|uniref:Coenzyme F420 hydrogenase/dehydrogenase, beta subunit C-terminal domain n=1 Tax=Arthrobacter sp. lap29 TaxID=3056122 RepID=UPI0028F6EED0|nr:Coenzyme F420 hydrogenase/dehydrogenase, beta subunit C-terminal domain [Arthrobacter sp. lap29]
MSPHERLDAAIKRVVEADNCSGCGGCVQLDPGLSMELNAEGYLRPVRKSPDVYPPEARAGTPTGAAGRPGRDVERDFAAACPGVRVVAQRPPGSHRHAQLGPVVQAWEAWANDPAVRHAGSSGGTLSALSAWLLETGQAATVIGAASDPNNARRTVPVQIISKEQALKAAGSRYAPVANASVPGARDAGTAFVGKPCEVSAIRALGPRGERASAEDGGEAAAGEGPLLLSFFCAGTPSQNATDRLAADLGVAEGAGVSELRYRGQGWPGDFSITDTDGTVRNASYDESWGQYLGPTTQWRCKICPDGVGESADITAADFWRTDATGYPLFTDRAGISALIARTERGRSLVLAAAAAGVLTLKAMDVAELVAVQPLQRKRRETLLARLAGTLAAGGSVPRFSGFSLWRLALPRLRESLRTARGTFRRRRGLDREKQR